MNPIITTEHFVMNISQREDVDRCLSRLDRVLPEGADFRLFLTLNRENQYRVLCKAHVSRADMVSEAAAYDLHEAVVDACHAFRQQVVGLKEKRARKRRVAHAIQE